MPLSGAAAPVRMLSSVVLPAPFGPTMPSRSPRAMRIEKSRISVRPPSAFEMSVRLDHQLAGGLGVADGELHLPGRRGAARAARAAARAAREAGPGCACAAPSRRSGASAARPRSCGRACGGRAPPARRPRRAMPRRSRSRGRAGGSSRGRARAWRATASSSSRRSWLTSTIAERDARSSCFQPFDGRQVEMVGRLVEDQDVGLRRQHARQRRAPRLAAGKPRRLLVAGEARARQAGSCAR